jgi:DNA repair exonuclease SbcCD nuclease subunit
MKLVHASDLHLGTPLSGIACGATRPALRALVSLCIDDRADLLLLAGDTFDATKRDHRTGAFFVTQMLRLRDHGIRVLSVRGNHDAEHRLVACLLLPDNVTELGLSGPETIVLDELGVAVHAESFHVRKTFDNIAARLGPPVAGMLNVGLLHTSADGREGHDPYAPCTLGQLRDRGYDYWALGHVHAREVHERGAWIVFPGNVQGRSMREAGPKGATVVTAEAGRIVRVEHRAVDVVRFEGILVDVTDAASLDDVVDRSTAELRSIPDDGRVRVVRLLLDGAPGIGTLLSHTSGRVARVLRAQACRVTDGRVWIEQIWAQAAEPLIRWRLVEDQPAI